MSMSWIRDEFFPEDMRVLLLLSVLNKADVEGVKTTLSPPARAAASKIWEILSEEYTTDYDKRERALRAYRSIIKPEVSA